MLKFGHLFPEKLRWYSTVVLMAGPLKWLQTSHGSVGRRYCILVEEAYGESECVITLHSLTLVPDDIMRFGSPDNYWCFRYERAVGRYVKETSNRKGIEKTFARKESQREFIKVWSERNKSDVQDSNQRGKFDQEKVFFISLYHYLWINLLTKLPRLNGITLNTV